MRAHLVQLNSVWEAKKENYARVRALLESADISRGDLIVLPEMFDTGFSFNTEATQDGMLQAGPNSCKSLGSEGPTLRFLKELGREHGVTVHGSRTIIDSTGKGRNLASVIGPDGAVLAEYAKIHPFSYGRETERFVGGTQVLTYTWTPGNGEAVTICPAVCYDLRFPELFRKGLQQGAMMYVIGANWPAPRAMHWRSLLIARAIENQAVVVGVNRTGKDPTLTYSGGSIAVSPKGEILGELGDEERVLSVLIDAGAVREWRSTFPAWKDMKL
jgi:omega-amidase